MFWYEENKNTQSSLFDDAETNRYIRHDCITDWILKEVRNRFSGSRAITKEHVFYYVYGLLHSKQYRERAYSGGYPFSISGDIRSVPS